MKKKWVSILFIVIALGLGVCSWLLLPDTVTVQVGFDGQATNTMPKLLAIVIPLCLSVFGSAMNLLSKEDKNNKKGNILAVVGIVALILNLLFAQPNITKIAFF